MDFAKKTVIVGGTFNSEGGRPSGYVRKLFWESEKKNPFIFNGGSLDQLAVAFMHATDPKTSTVYWFADVPNTAEKTVDRIKVMNPKTLLVISKNNREGKYGPLDLINRALRAKANLLVEFTQGKDGKIEGTVWDPLGNSFVYRDNYPSP